MQAGIIGIAINTVGTFLQELKNEEPINSVGKLNMIDKEKSTEKVDGAVAMVMALDRAMKSQSGGESVYNERGLLILG